MFYITKYNKNNLTLFRFIRFQYGKFNILCNIFNITYIYKKKLKKYIYIK